jgi:hypothetical protein
MCGQSVLLSSLTTMLSDITILLTSLGYAGIVRPTITYCLLSGTEKPLDFGRIKPILQDPFPDMLFQHKNLADRQRRTGLI